MTNLLDHCPAGNSETEPDLLIVHCPRTVSIMKWDDISRGLVEWLRAESWTIRRQGDAIHAITPLHPAVIQ